ncbi:MAG: hypothetical protein AseanaTS_04540 [Candidatus Pelagadaptatus aseana]|uniref:response regulator n=1 Tax=Candidatus Pelagadaptatus aseana TaxID=3120508 RepID=UPI0039B18339
MLNSATPATYHSLTISNVLATLSTLMGALVLVGWYTENVNLIQVNPSFVPMQYNTALGFLLSGLGLLTLNQMATGITKLLGSLVAILGWLTLCQYLFGWNLGLDQLFMQHYIDINTSHPGRMAPNTALCFGLVGVALVYASRPTSDRQDAITATLGSVIAALGLVAFSGYLSGVQTTYGWGALTKMAVHTSAGFILLGAGLFNHGVHSYYNKHSEQTFAAWLSWPVGIFGLTLTATLWQAMHAYEQSLQELSGVHSGYADESMLLFGLISTIAAILTINQQRFAKDQGIRRHLKVDPSMVLLLGVILSASIFQLLQSNFEARVRQNFYSEVEHRGNSITQMATLYLENLYRAQALFYASEEVTQEEFRKLSSADTNRYAGIRSVQWMPVVPASEKAGFEQRQAELLGTGFNIYGMTKTGETAAIEAKDYFPVTFIEPFQTNKNWLGYSPANSGQLFSPVSIEQALIERSITLSSVITLEEDGRTTKLVEAMMPIFREQTSGPDHLLGFVGITIEPGVMISNILADYLKPAGLNMEFIDATDADAPEQVHWHTSRIYNEANNAMPLSQNYSIRIGNRTLTMIATAANEQTYPRWSASNIAPSLTILVIAITLAMMMKMSRRREAERNKFQAAIAERERQLGALVDTIPGAAYSCQLDEHWTMQYLSPNAELVTGYSSEGFINNRERSWNDIIHPDDRDYVSNAAHNAVENHQDYTLEYRIIKANGTIAWVFEKGQAIYDQQGSPLELHGTVLDINDRKLMEGKFQGLLEAAPDSVIIINNQGDIAFVNREAEKTFGYGKEELLGEKIEMLLPDAIRAHHPKMRQEYFEAPRVRAMGSGRELLAKTKSNREIPVEISLSPLHTDEGLLVFAAIRDITLRRKMEIDLINAKERAVEATQAKGEFLANMSHEIRTPMNAIIGMAELALDTDLNPSQYNYINKVHRSAESLLGIINDILDFSKIEAGKLNVEAIDFRLEDVLDNIGGLLAFKAEEKGLELMFDLEDQLPSSLIGDPLRLGQILLNLGNNAVKFTEQGEVIIRVSQQSRQGDDVTLQFEIKDTGIGIDKDMQRSLFDSFSQADTSTTRKFGGTGLGLTISKSLTELMGGEISCESAPGQGSTFTFSAKLTISSANIARADISDIAPMRVLVVDDNSSSREIIGSILDRFGLRVELATNGLDALGVLEQAEQEGVPYDLVIMDWKMPELDGIETTRLIQNDDKLSTPPTIIMVTAYGRESAVEAASQVDIKGFLTKPVTPSTLLDTILLAKGKEIAISTRSGDREEEIEQASLKLAGARVLLVEDNDINMELAVDVLERQNISVATAINGQEALDKLATEQFDGVLMDCQMPVMDGYEATGKIREQDQFRDLPILAMTANAMAGDKEKVLAAGMNDHIAKPIQRRELFMTMARWITPAQPANPKAKRLPDNATATALPDIEGINVGAGLETCQGNSELYVSLLRKFAHREADFKQRFLDSMTDNDEQTKARVAHTLKGVAANIAANEVQQAAAALELQCSEERPDAEILATLDVVQAKLERVIPNILAGLPDDQPAIPADSSQSQESFDHLRQLLADSDAEALTAVNKLRGFYADDADMVALLEAIADAVDQFDFEQAEALLNQHMEAHS